LKLDLVSGRSEAIGIFMISVGMLILAFGTYRYFRILILLERNEFETNLYGVIGLVVVTLGVVVAFLVLVIVDNEPTTFTVITDTVTVLPNGAN